MGGHPVLGSLLSFIQAQADRGDGSLSYLDGRFIDLAAWKTEARRRVLDLLHYAPAPVDPAPWLIERVDCGDHWRESVEFSTTPDIRVPAFVLIPKGLTKPAPGIVALHDHGGFYLWGREKLVELPGEHPTLTEFRRTCYAGRSIAVEMVRRGHVVVVIDMFYWGDRRLVRADDGDDWRTRRGLTPERIAAFNGRSGAEEQLVARGLYTAGATWSGVMFWDDIRTVDYLLTRPEVDPARIGCVGLSVGGYRSLHLAALDPRIRAAVVVGWMASFPAQLAHHLLHTIGFTMLVPGLYREMDLPDVASLAAPNALMVINGTRDGLFELPGVRRAHERIAACYRKAGVAERFAGRIVDEPHEFSLAMQGEAWAWLERWLG
ncbi:MAG TPA: alpha/beta hydrolase family protein [Planctomycetota bacterium]|nr:alpha/beta hydrolase family protein [Planctomycetota bacterium]